MKTQVQKVLKHLEENGSITSWDAIMQYRITRLSAVIYLIKKMGYIIKTDIVYYNDESGETRHYAKYVLEGKE